VLIVSLRKYELRSLIKIFGHPNLVNTYSKRNFVVIEHVQSFIGYASTHLVKYLVVVMMYCTLVFFLGGWIGPTKSIAHFSNGFNVTCGINDNSSLHDVLPVLDMRHKPYNMILRPYVELATTIQHAEPSALFLFLHNVLLRLLHEPLWGCCFTHS